MVTAAYPSAMAATTAEKPRSAITDSIQSTWARWTMHQSSGTTLTEVGGKTGFTGQTINGTTTNVWSSRDMWFTPDPTAGNYVTIAPTYADTIFSLDDLTEGGVFIVCSINVAANPGSGSEYLWYYGAATAFYGVLLQGGGALNVNSFTREVGGALTAVTSTAITGEIGNDIVIGYYADVSNQTYSYYANEATASKALAFVGDGSALVGTGTPSNLGLGIFGRGDGVTPLGQAGTGSGTTMRNLFAIRFTSDRSADIPAIMQGFIDNPSELPWALEGL